MRLKLILASLMLVATVGFAQAQTEEKPVVKKECFVDADANGVCDKFEAKTCANGSGTGLPNCSQKPADSASCAAKPCCKSDSTACDAKPACCKAKVADGATAECSKSCDKPCDKSCSTECKEKCTKKCDKSPKDDGSSK